MVQRLYKAFTHINDDRNCPAIKNTRKTEAGQFLRKHNTNIFITITENKEATPE